MYTSEGIRKARRDAHGRFVVIPWDRVAKIRVEHPMGGTQEVTRHTLRITEDMVPLPAPGVGGVRRHDVGRTLVVDRTKDGDWIDVFALPGQQPFGRGSHHADRHETVLESQRQQPNYLRDVFPRSIHRWHSFSKAEQARFVGAERSRLHREGWHENRDGSWTQGRARGRRHGDLAAIQAITRPGTSPHRVNVVLVDGRGNEISVLYKNLTADKARENILRRWKEKN